MFFYEIITKVAEVFVKGNRFHLSPGWVMQDVPFFYGIKFDVGRFSSYLLCFPCTEWMRNDELCLSLYLSPYIIPIQLSAFWWNV